jgi:hypothetical protein
MVATTLAKLSRWVRYSSGGRGVVGDGHQPFAVQTQSVRSIELHGRRVTVADQSLVATPDLGEARQGPAQPQRRMVGVVLAVVEEGQVRLHAGASRLTQRGMR